MIIKAIEKEQVSAQQTRNKSTNTCELNVPDRYNISIRDNRVTFPFKVYKPLSQHK